MITAFIYTTQAVVKIRLKKFGLERDSNPWPLQNWCSALPCQLAKHPNMGAAKSFISRYSKQNIVVVEIVNCQFLASYHNEAVVSDSFRCYLFWYGSCYLLVRCVSHRKKTIVNSSLIFTENEEFVFKACSKVDKIEQNSSHTKNTWNFW